MSRHNIYEPPVIDPKLRQRWEDFRAHKAAEWQKAWKAVHLSEETGDPANPGRYMGRLPNLHSFHTKDFRSYSKPKETSAVEWGSARGNVLKRAEWDADPFVCVATVEPDDSTADWSFVGDWTDKEPDSPAFRSSWSWPKDPKAPHPNGGRLRSPDDMLYWMTGGLDTTMGKGRDHGKFRYRRLAYYDYYSERRMWWLLGYTKAEADRLARLDLAERFKRFDDITENRIGMVGVVVKVYLADDEDQEDELALGSLWNIEDDSGDDYFASVALECADRAISDAKDNIRRRVARYQPHLPGISP